MVSYAGVKAENAEKTAAMDKEVAEQMEKAAKEQQAIEKDIEGLEKKAISVQVAAQQEASKAEQEVVKAVAETEAKGNDAVNVQQKKVVEANVARDQVTAV